MTEISSAKNNHKFKIYSKCLVTKNMRESQTEVNDKKIVFILKIIKIKMSFNYGTKPETYTKMTKTS